MGLRELARTFPECRIIMPAVSNSADDLFDSLQSGAVGYLLKDIPSSEVPAAVHNALAGRAVLDGVLTARVLEEFRRGRCRITEATSSEGRRVRFTPRESRSSRC